MLLANLVTEKGDTFKIFGKSGLLFCHDLANAFASLFPVYFVIGRNLALAGSNIK